MLEPLNPTKTPAKKALVKGPHTCLLCEPFLEPFEREAYPDLAVNGSLRDRKALGIWDGAWPGYAAEAMVAL